MVGASRARDFGAAGRIAVGLLFLLPADVQLTLVRKVARVLNCGGRFLFTAPEPVCAWTDILTGRRSVSLGGAAYEMTLFDAGLVLTDEYDDEGENHYFDACKP